MIRHRAPGQTKRYKDVKRSRVISHGGFPMRYLSDTELKEWYASIKRSALKFEAPRVVSRLRIVKR